MHTIELPLDYVIVLQQVYEHGQEDMLNLVESLRFDQGRLRHIVKALQSKRLIRVNKTGYTSWIILSARGRRLMTGLWPESMLRNKSRTTLSRF